MTVVRYFNTVPGAVRVYHSSLSGAVIYGVKREGVGLTEVAISTQTNREFSSAFGSIYVDPLIPFNAGEKIWVMYEN